MTLSEAADSAVSANALDYTGVVRPLEVPLNSLAIQGMHYRHRC